MSVQTHLDNEDPAPALKTPFHMQERDSVCQESRKGASNTGSTKKYSHPPLILLSVVPFAHVIHLHIQSAHSQAALAQQQLTAPGFRPASATPRKNLALISPA
jgi:hypothetical protein